MAGYSYAAIYPAETLDKMHYDAMKKADALRRRGDSYGAEKLEAWAKRCEEWKSEQGEKT
jgi:hypothetical protein